VESCRGRRGGGRRRGEEETDCSRMRVGAEGRVVTPSRRVGHGAVGAQTTPDCSIWRIQTGLCLLRANHLLQSCLESVQRPPLVLRLVRSHRRSQSRSVLCDTPTTRVQQESGPLASSLVVIGLAILIVQDYQGPRRGRCTRSCRWGSNSYVGSILFLGRIEGLVGCTSRIGD
jgi:hypothetical protein